VSTDFPTASVAHPAELEAADQPYFAPWGRPQILLTLVLGFPALVVTAALAVRHSPWWWGGTLVAALLAGFFVLFFRNPRRTVPVGSGLLVSPADGTIWDVEEVDEPDFIGERCLRIGIFLSIFNVHVNRTPASGRVAYVQYREGAFHDARSTQAGDVNESNAIGLVRLEGSGPEEVKLLVKQISGAIARRIICPLTVGQGVTRGGLIGMIKYGSRTELYVPLSSGGQARVKVGDKVQGGVSILAHWVDTGARRGD